MNGLLVLIEIFFRILEKTSSELICTRLYSKEKIGRETPVIWKKILLKSRLAITFGTISTRILQLQTMKNPESEEEIEYLRKTPLEIAADNDQWEICEYMLENINCVWPFRGPTSSVLELTSSVKDFFVAFFRLGLRRSLVWPDSIGRISSP